jgi:Na+/H+-translocating membrane pyrophosphatase
MLHFAYAPVFVPLVYGIGSVCIALLSAYLTDNRGNRKSLFPLVVFLLAAFLLVLLAQWLIKIAFPVTWVKNGKEYTSQQLAQLWSVAIAFGYLAGSFEKVYPLVMKRYVDYLLHYSARQVAYNVFLHVLVNHIVAYLPTLLIIVALIYAYINGGIYGTALAVLGTVSNLGSSKVSVANSSLNEHLQYLADGAKRKLCLLSPPMAALIRKSNRLQKPKTIV